MSDHWDKMSIRSAIEKVLNNEMLLPAIQRKYEDAKGSHQMAPNVGMSKGHIKWHSKDAKGSHQMAPNVADAKEEDAKGSHQMAPNVDAKGSHQMAPNVGRQSHRIVTHAFVMIPLPIPVNRSICRIDRPISLRRRSALSRSFFGNPTM